MTSGRDGDVVDVIINDLTRSGSRLPSWCACLIISAVPVAAGGRITSSTYGDPGCIDMAALIRAYRLCLDRINMNHSNGPDGSTNVPTTSAYFLPHSLKR